VKLILIGFMASGKTSVSHFLHQELGLPLLDLDQEIERRTGQTIPEIFATGGEEQFRQIEHQTLSQVAAFPGILATGGGTPLRADNQQILAATAAPVVLLKASPEVTYARLRRQTGRPLADNLTIDGISQLQEQRRAVYDRCADITINTDDLAVTEIAKQIMPLIHLP
jgi:shikimate kinase